MVSKRNLVLVCCLFCAPSNLFPRQEIRPILINVREQAGLKDQPVPAYINGYRRSLSGQTITYRSPHPDAETALLVRARKEVRSIVWETDTIAEALPGEYYHFLWLAGLEREGFQNLNEVHTFELMINGEQWFRFQNRKDASAKNWTVKGRNGAELSFEATMVDRVGDLFGYMRMRIPGTSAKPGKPLSLQVIGEDAGSSDWFMVFQYSFDFVPRLRLEPVLLREGALGAQVLRLSLDNLRSGRTLEIDVPNRERIIKPLNVGANIVFVPIDPVERQRLLPISYAVDGKLLKVASVSVRPVARRDIYLLSYSHNDIGYTDLQPNIEKKQWRNLEEALQIIERTKGYPPEARYKWNMEVLWALDSYLQQASDERRQEVIAAIRSGSIGLNALYANVLTGLANAVEMTQLTAFARELSAMYSIPITTALVSDIPGFTWGIVPALAHSGVKYFSISPNPFDRIGYTLETWGDKPFYWTSQSGEEKIMTWVAGASYASFHEGDLTRLGEEKLLKLMRRLDATGYPYDIVQLPYTIGGDNGPPDPDLPDFVKRWNERYATPRLIIATHAQMFEEFEKRFGGTLPSFAGDFTPYWEDGALSSACETALNRRAADRLIQGEALWATLAPASFPAGEYGAAWRNVVLYDEHTWGAHNSVSEPDLSFVKGQWKIKRQFALDADSLSRTLLQRVIPPPPKQTGKRIGIDVYNTTAWLRTDVVFLSKEQSSVGDRVTDHQGQPVPSQRLSTGELAVLTASVPPLSAKRFFVEKGAAHKGDAVTVTTNKLENRLLSLAVNEQTGAIENLVWKEKGMNLVDRTGGGGLNRYLYVLGKDPQKACGLTRVRVRPKERGSLVGSLLVEADAPGCIRYTCEIRIAAGLPWVDIIHRIDKRAVREKEGVHIAYPFDIRDGVLRYDVAGGMVRPEVDQLPGACKNFFSVQSWVDISSDSLGVTWATVDAPLIEIGAITAEQPWMKTIEPSRTFYSYVMNNYWHTNYKADQEGPVTFRYSLRPHASFKPSDAVRFAKERREPLLVTYADTSRPPMRSLFAIDSFDLVVLSVRPIEGGNSWLVHLYNPTDVDRKTVMLWNRSIPAAIHTSDVFGRRGERVGGPFDVPAYGSRYIRIDRK